MIEHNTFTLKREYPTKVQRVFAAFSDPAKKRRWFAEGGTATNIEEFAMDFRVGGSERAVYRFKEGSLFPGDTYSTESSYQDIVPDSRIVLVYTTTFGGRRVSVCLATIEFVANGHGTSLILTHQGAFFEGSDGPKMREQGWTTILSRLGPELEAA